MELSDHEYEEEERITAQEEAKGELWLEERIREDQFKLLGTPAYLAILEAIEDGYHNSSSISRVVGTKQPTVWKELQELFRVGLLESRTESRTVYFSLSPDAPGVFAEFFATETQRVQCYLHRLDRIVTKSRERA